jgi:hypothetical protein
MKPEELNVVRINSLGDDSREFTGTPGIARPPKVGDAGTIVHVHSDTMFMVECVDSSGRTVWLAEFHRGEIETIPREVDVELEFLSAEQGGRRTAPRLDHGVYRPHLRVPPSTELLGVEFVGSPGNIGSESRMAATARALFGPEVPYELLRIGVKFEVVEGPRVVGFGRVMRVR